MSSHSLLSGRTLDSASTIAEPTLLAMLEGSPEEASKACEALRRSLSHTPVTLDVAAVAAAVLRVLERYPGQLRVSHLCVAVLAHPALNTAPHAFEPAVLRALERLAMSAAFVHTALAALQNAAAASAKSPRDPVLSAVVVAMRQHPTHTGILLRAADLIAFHLNQPVAPPAPSTFELCAQAVIGAAPRLYGSPQGASAGLLALVACARHSVAATSSHHGHLPIPSVRNRSSGHYYAVVDAAFASVVVQAMNKHKEFAPVQVLSAELVRVAGNGATNAARMAAREFFHAGALNALLISIHTHHGDDTVVERSLAALRSLLLLGSTGNAARTAKPTIALSPAVADAVVTMVEQAAVAMTTRNPDVASSAKVLASDVRIAAASASSSSLSASSQAAATSAAVGREQCANGATTQNNTGIGRNGGGGRDSSRSFSVVAFGRRFFSRSLRMGGRKDSSGGAGGRDSRADTNRSDGPPSTGRFPHKPYASGHVLGSPPMGGASGSGLVFANSVAGMTRASNGVVGTELDSGPLNFKLYGSGGRGPGASSSLVSGRSVNSADSNTSPAASGQRWRVDSPHSSSQQQRWRNVGGRWYGRAGRQQRPNNSVARKARSPGTAALALTGAEGALLTRQPTFESTNQQAVTTGA